MSQFASESLSESPVIAAPHPAHVHSDRSFGYFEAKGTTFDTEFTYEIWFNRCHHGGQVLFACFCHSGDIFPFDNLSH